MRESFTIVFPFDGKIGRRSEQQAQQIDFEAGSGQFVSEQEIETQLGHKRDRAVQDVISCPILLEYGGICGRQEWFGKAWRDSCANVGR